MKKLVLGLHLVVVFAVAHAGTETHQYRAKVSGPAGCTMPADPEHPAVGDCAVKMRTFETGSKVVEKDGLCIETVTELIQMRKIRSGDREIDSPELQSRTATVKCPSSLLGNGG